MATSSRRDFLSSLGAMALLPLRQTQPQTVLYNANVLTMDANNPSAQAIAIVDGRFLAVGSKEEILNLVGSGATKVDLDGKTVVPGFIDAHSHPCSAGLQHLREVDCDLRSISEIQASIWQRAAYWCQLKSTANSWVAQMREGCRERECQGGIQISS